MAALWVFVCMHVECSRHLSGREAAPSHLLRPRSRVLVDECVAAQRVFVCMHVSCKSGSMWTS